MSNMRLMANEKQDGKVVYNADIIQSIVELAIAEVEGATPVEDKKRGVVLRIEKDGVYATASVVVKYGYNVPELAYRVQQSVKQSVENMTNFKVLAVDVHVADVVFIEQPSVERDEEQHEEDGAAETTRNPIDEE